MDKQEIQKKTVKEMSTIGPLTFDGSIEISAESKDEKGQIIKGKTMAIEPDIIHISFPSAQEKFVADSQERVEAEKFKELVEMYYYRIISRHDIAVYFSGNYRKE